jgi:D-alanyl-D-alanine carboxypeptidase
VIVLLKRFCAILLIFLFVPISVFASDNISVSATSYCVMDASTHEVLLQQNSSLTMPMASTTKIMTCLLAVESGKLDDLVQITFDMINTEGSMIYLDVGDEISLLDLVKGAMLSSGNDAANAIAIYLGGSIDDFVSMMNLRAQELGMKNTHFVTPSGLDEGDHHSTAYDMALLASFAMSNTLFSQICSKQSDTINISGTTQTIYNHNKLLSTDGFVGVKTGYTSSAGRCLVSGYEYQGNTIITVTLGDPNDWDDHKTLVEKAKSYTKYSKTENFTINVVGATKQNLKASCTYEVLSTKSVNVKAYYYPFVYAPVKKGDVVGYLNVTVDDEIIKTVDITAMEGINCYGKQ